MALREVLNVFLREIVLKAYVFPCPLRFGQPAALDPCRRSKAWSPKLLLCKLSRSSSPLWYVSKRVTALESAEGYFRVLCTLHATMRVLEDSQDKNDIGTLWGFIIILGLHIYFLA